MDRKAKRVKDKQRAKRKEKKRLEAIKGEAVLYKCTECEIEEFIPRDVVEMFDEIDDENIYEPPTFSCEACGGIMRPKNYEGVRGVTYKF